MLGIEVTSLRINDDIEIGYIEYDDETIVETINGVLVSDFIYDAANWDSYNEMVADVTRWYNENQRVDARTN